MAEDLRARLGDATDLADGEMRACRAGKFDVVLCRVGADLYAIEDLCSHAESTLSDGLLDGPVITCPLHFASFDVRDGSHLGPPAFTGIRTFGVVEDPSGVTIELPTPEPDASAALPPGMFRTR